MNEKITRVCLPLYFESNLEELWGISTSGARICGTYSKQPGGGVARGMYRGFSGLDIKTITYLLPKIANAAIGQCRRTHVYEDVFPDPVFPAVAVSARGVNDAGDHVGFYRDALGEVHGFTWLQGQPAPERFDSTNASFVAAPADNTIDNAVFGINDTGQIVGVYRDRKTGDRVGYVALASQSGVASDLKLALKTFEFEVNKKVVPTIARGVNDSGDVVGTYFDPIGGRRGWVSLHPWTDMKSVEVPVSTATETVLAGINDSKAVAGSYVAGGQTHAFTGWLDSDGALYGFSSFDVPLAVWTVLNGIDNAGTVAGAFENDTSATTGVPGSRRRYGFTASTMLDPLEIEIPRRLPNWLFSPHDVQRLQEAATLQLADNLLSQLAHPLIREQLTKADLQPTLRTLQELLRQVMPTAGR